MTFKMHFMLAIYFFQVDAKPEVGSVKGLALLLQNALETQDNPPEGASIASSPASQEVEKDER